MTKDLPIDPRVTEFLTHLETGLAQAGLDFEDFNPTYVQLYDEENRDKLIGGCIFSQVINPVDTDRTVCVAPDGISFPAPNKTKLPFSIDQPPSMVAILFLVAMIQEEIIDPPSCPHCEAESEHKK